MKKREIIALLASTMIIFESFLSIPALATTEEKVTVYFHEDYEDYVVLNGSYGHLDESLPTESDASDAAAGIFDLRNVSEINGNMYFDLYFSIPIATSNVANLLEHIITVASESVSNETNPGNLTEIVKDIISSILNTSWTNLISNISKISLSGRENFTIQVIENSNTIAEKTITVKREVLGGSNISVIFESIMENISYLNISNLFNLGKQLTQNVQHVTFTIPNVNCYDSNVTIQIEAENELALARELIEQLNLEEITKQIEEGNTSAINTLVNLLKNISYYPKDKNLSQSEIEKLKRAAKVIRILLPFIESLINIGFVYDSIDYPSRVTFDGKLKAGGRETGRRRYFLREIGGEKVLSKNPSLDENPEKIGISSDGEEWIVYPPYTNATKISGNANITLYIDYPSFQDLTKNLTIKSLFSIIYTIKASLLDVDENGNTTEIASGTVTKNVFRAGETTQIEINDLDYILKKNHTLALKISLASYLLYNNSLNISIANFSLSDLVNWLNNLGFNLAGFLEIEPTLLYDASNTSSYIDLTLTPPDNIKIQLEKGINKNQDILRSGHAVYNITVINMGEERDTVNITVYARDTAYSSTSGWSYSLEGNDSKVITWEKSATKYIAGSVNIDGKSSRKLKIVVTPPSDAEYGDSAEVHILASGEMGRDEFIGKVTLSPENREFGVKIIKPANREVRKGGSYTYLFKIRNTGNDAEDLVITVESKENWEIESDISEIRLYPGDEGKVNVTVKVPENVEAGTEDLLIFTVSSNLFPSDKESVIVVTTAVNPTIAQLVTKFFDDSARTIGLEKVIGPAAGLVLLLIVLAILAIIICIAFYLIVRKLVLLICLDRVKEVEVDGEEKFEIIVKNPTRLKMIYDIVANEDSEGWDVSLSDKRVTLDAGQEKKIYLSVRANSLAGIDGYAEIKVTAIPKYNIKKKRTISLLAMIKGAKLDLKIANVFHWPKIFKGGEIVTTRFSVRNNGNVTAKNLSIILSVNGVERNRVDNISIPPGGYADVKMPWRAFHGKNSLHIAVLRPKED